LKGTSRRQRIKNPETLDGAPAPESSQAGKPITNPTTHYDSTKENCSIQKRKTEKEFKKKRESVVRRTWTDQKEPGLLKP